MENGTFLGGRHESFLSFLYWSGVRRREALERLGKHFHVESEILFVDITPPGYDPLKHGALRAPLELDIDLPYLDIVLSDVAQTGRNERVWSFSETTAWRIVKRVFPKKYPHFFRLNRATRFLEDPTTTIPEMKAWFGWKDTKTISSYIGLSPRYQRAGRMRLRREVQEEEG
jgi:hypothetical protein